VLVSNYGKFGKSGGLVMKKADYSKIASFYDKGRLLSDEILSLWTDLVSGYAGDPAQTRLLDLGCGTGRFTIAIAERLGYHVTGADMSGEMLARAKEKDTDNRIIWDQQDAQHLTYGDKSFNAVFISHLLHHVDSPLSVLREAGRVLDSPGVILLRYGAIEQIEHDVVHRFFPETREIDRARTPSVSTVEGWLKEAGFKNISSEEIKQRTWETPEDVLRSIRYRNTSVLTLISEKAYEKGLNELTEYISEHPDDPWLLDDKLMFTAGHV
jgi:ubiquinone/menaquinone biosynthesis C-methylase UbiE